jgi:hypothetical protein
MLGALSWTTCANGMVLLPTLAVEEAHQFRTTRRWLWIALVPAGFGVYLLLTGKLALSRLRFCGHAKRSLTSQLPGLGSECEAISLIWTGEARRKRR